MSRLTDKQIDYIADQVNQSKIESIELKEDLIDHLCCIIEEDIKQGVEFEDAYKKAYLSVCPNGFDEIHQESILLLTSKKLSIMRKLLFIVGFITSLLLTTSLLFKAMHWPGAGIALAISFFTTTFGFLPLLLLFLYKNEFSKYASYKLKYIFGFIGLAISLTGLAFRVFHWPGASILILVGVFILNFGFLPFLFYRMYHKTGNTSDSMPLNLKLIYIFGFVGAVMFLTASLLKLQHWPGSGVILVLSVAVLNFGFLPLLFYNLYKKSLA